MRQPACTCTKGLLRAIAWAAPACTRCAQQLLCDPVGSASLRVPGATSQPHPGQHKASMCAVCTLALAWSHHCCQILEPLAPSSPPPEEALECACDGVRMCREFHTRRLGCEDVISIVLWGGARDCATRKRPHPWARRHGHEDAVSCIALSTDQDLCVSAALEGTLLFHTLSHGRCAPPAGQPKPGLHPGPTLAKPRLLARQLRPARLHCARTQL